MQFKMLTYKHTINNDHNLFKLYKQKDFTEIKCEFNLELFLQFIYLFVCVWVFVPLKNCSFI